MRFIITLICGILGAEIFSRIGNKNNPNNSNKKSLNDFWYKYNHPYLKNNSRYNNHCWKCGARIDSFYNEQCPKCGWYKCHVCGACQNYPNCETERFK